MSQQPGQPPNRLMNSIGGFLKRAVGAVAETACFPCEGMPGCETLSIGVRCSNCDVPICNNHAAFFPLTGNAGAMCPGCIAHVYNEAKAEVDENEDKPRRRKRRAPKDET